VRLVFDTNVYISAFIVPGSRSDFAYRLAERGTFELAVSSDILADLRFKLHSKFGYSEAEVESVERAVRDTAVVVEPGVELSVLDDEADNRVLECAVASGASAIVTGDRHLLRLGTYQGIGIMTVSDLLYAFPEIP
jgi:uncharacterized protein